MVNDLNMGLIFYDKVKKKPEEKKVLDLERFMEGTTIKRLLFLTLKIVVIPLIIALFLALFLGGGFTTIFIIILVVMLAFHIITFLKAWNETRL